MAANMIKCLYTNQRILLLNQRFSFNHVSSRKFGITDTIINFATNTVEQTKEKQFASMVESMVSLKDFTMRSYKESLDKQLTSWMMYVPGVSKQADTNQLKQFQALMNNMTSQELDNPNLITAVSKQRIAVSAGQPVENVDMVLVMYKNMKVISLWLKMKKENNEKMPTSEREMMAMQVEDVRVRTLYKESMVKRKSGRGKGVGF